MLESKVIQINGNLTHYEIYSDGTLKNLDTNKFLKGTVNGNYRIYSIRFNNKTYRYRAHRLVAEYFLQNPNNLPVVHHIDGNTLNNNKENLQWVDYEDNNTLTHPRNLITDEVFEEDADIWQPFRDSYYLISQTGKIKNARNNTLLKGSLDQYGYKYFHLHSTINKNIWIHRAVWETFGDNLIDGMVINHIDGNKLNNHIDNLEQVSSKENKQHELRALHPEKNKIVYQFDKKGNLLAIYASINECARQLNLDSRHISSCVQDKIASVKGFIFCSSSDDFMKRKHQPPKEIAQYDLNGQLIKIYPSITEAVRTTGFSKSNIINCLNGQYKTANGFKWKRM